MNYGTYLGNCASVEKTSIAQDRTNPSQIGYSISKPLNRVRNHSLTNTVAANGLNYPLANLNTTPSNSFATLGSLAESSSQFASDLLDESKSLLTGSLVNGVPNTWLFAAIGISLVILKTSGTGYKRGRR